jgi:hypothetical protein
MNTRAGMKWDAVYVTAYPQCVLDTGGKTATRGIYHLDCIYFHLHVNHFYGLIYLLFT